MKDLNFEELNERLRYDCITGNLYWKFRKETNQQTKAWNTRFAETVAGSIKDTGYLYITLNRKHHMAHRIVWILVHKQIPPCFIDHIDQNKLNNKIENLRKATKSQNQHNQNKPITNTSGFKGVCRKRNRWFVQIRCNGTNISLGTFPLDKLKEAAECYRKAALKYHKDFACF